MKRYLLVFSILCLVGCGKKNDNVVCVQNYNVGYDYTEEVTAVIKDDKVTELKAVQKFDDGLDTLVQCESIKSLKDYDIPDLDYSCGKKEISINNYELLTDIDEKIIGMSKQEVIDLFTKYQYACK